MIEIEEYKGYKIMFSTGNGEFSISGVSGTYVTYSKATAKIDRVVSAENNKNFPVEAIYNMGLGKITSYNSETQEVWFTTSNGSRGKHRVRDYNGRKQFFKATEANKVILEKHNVLVKQKTVIDNDIRDNMNLLSEHVEFSGLKDDA